MCVVVVVCCSSSDINSLLSTYKLKKIVVEKIKVELTGALLLYCVVYLTISYIQQDIPFFIL